MVQSIEFITHGKIQALALINLESSNDTYFNSQFM